MLYWVGIIAVAFIINISPTYKAKKAIILHKACGNFYCILHMVITKAVHVITCSGDTYHKLIGISFHSLFKPVVLRRLFIGRQLIGYSKVAVKGILRIWIARKYLYLYTTIWLAALCKCVLDTMLNIAILNREFINELIVPKAKQDKVKAF